MYLISESNYLLGSTVDTYDHYYDLGAARLPPADYLDLDLDRFLGEALRDLLPERFFDLLFDLLLDLLFERLLERDRLLDFSFESRLRLLDRDLDLDLDLDRDLDLDLDLDRDFRLLRSSVSRMRLSTSTRKVVILIQDITTFTCC